QGPLVPAGRPRPVPHGLRDGRRTPRGPHRPRRLSPPAALVPPRLAPFARVRRRSHGDVIRATPARPWMPKRSTGFPLALAVDWSGPVSSVPETTLLPLQ